MKLYIKTIIILIASAFIITSCGGSSTNPSANVTGGYGSLTLSGTEAATIGTSFTPQAINLVPAPNTTTWSGDNGFLLYSDAIDANTGAPDYTLSFGLSLLANSPGTQIQGLTVNNGTYTFTNVTLNGIFDPVTNTTTTLILNGTLTTQ